MGSLLVATPAQAITDTGTGGVFVPASGRILDTKTGIGGYDTPMVAGSYRTIKVAGLAGLPTDGSVGAVSLNATVSGSSSNGTLFGRPDADTSRTNMLIYNATAGEYVSNSAVVAVSDEGTIQIATESSARVILDVQGYYTANTDGTVAGGFVPVAGKRIVDTRSGLGAPKALLAPGKSVDIQVGGTNSVPSNASGAVVNLLPINATDSDGYLTPYATGSSRPTSALHYAPSTSTSIQAQVKLSAAGKMTIYNGSSSANLVIDLQGYFTATGSTGATFTPGIGRVFDSRTSTSTILAKNETRAIQVAGRAGVPVAGSGISAVVLTLTAYHAGSDGRASVWANGEDKPDTTSINFRNDEIRTNTVTVPLGANGKINLNNVADPTHYLIDIQGWYVNTAAPKIACDGPFEAGSWVHSASPETPVNCTFSAPAATSTGDTLDVTVNGLPMESFPLSETGPSQFSWQVPLATGRITLGATIWNASGAGPTSAYAFGVGNWSDDELAPSVATDSVVDPSQIALYPIPTQAGSLPSDAKIVYTIVDKTAGTSQVAETDNLPLGLMDAPRGHVFTWSAKIAAASDWGKTSTSSSPEWSFRVAEEGETIPTNPEAEASADDHEMTVMKTPNGCTLSPEKWGKANFTPACNTHDYCYVNKKKINRQTCDVAFAGNLIAACVKAYKPGFTRNTCIGVTGVYVTAVRLGGWKYYKGNGKNN